MSSEEDLQAPQEATAGNRKQLTVIVVVAAITLGGSYLAFYLAQSFGGWGTTNKGEFVTPPSTTDALGWVVSGERRKWWIWTVAGDCDAPCQDTVRNMRALHVLLNREANRVRRGHTDSAGRAPAAWMTQYPQLARVELAAGTVVDDGVYLVDPNGNLVLRYPLDTDPKAVLEDLKRLLKLSQIG